MASQSYQSCRIIVRGSSLLGWALPAERGDWIRWRDREDKGANPGAAFRCMARYGIQYRGSEGRDHCSNSPSWRSYDIHARLLRAIGTRIGRGGCSWTDIGVRMLADISSVIWRRETYSITWRNFHHIAQIWQDRWRVCLRSFPLTFLARSQGLLCARSTSCSAWGTWWDVPCLSRHGTLEQKSCVISYPRRWFTRIGSLRSWSETMSSASLRSSSTLEVRCTERIALIGSIATRALRDAFGPKTDCRGCSNLRMDS